MRALAISGALLLLPALCMALYPAAGISVEIPFGFLAGGKLLPAGTYRFTENESGGALKVTNVKTDESVMVPIFTRIAPQSDAEVIFDKVGDKHHISEVYLPGVDGFLLKAAPARHTHVRAKGRK